MSRRNCKKKLTLIDKNKIKKHKQTGRARALNFQTRPGFGTSLKNCVGLAFLTGLETLIFMALFKIKNLIFLILAHESWPAHQGFPGTSCNPFGPDQGLK